MWTDEKVEQLVDLWSQGLTAFEISEVLGATRSQIMGKISRLRRCGTDLGHRSTAPKRKHRKKITASPVHREAGKAGEGESSKVPPSTLTPPPLPPPVPKIGFWENVVAEIYYIGDRECRYPLGDPVKGFCRSPTERGSSYCPYHKQLTQPQRYTIWPASSKS